MSETLHARILRTLFRAGTPVATTRKAADELVAEIEDRITSAIRDYADSERAAMVCSDSYLQRFDITAYEQMKHLVDDASDIAKYALSERRTDESLQISERGMAVIESGLTLRQAHEIKTGCSQDNLCAECRKETI